MMEPPKVMYNNFFLNSSSLLMIKTITDRAKKVIATIVRGLQAVEVTNVTVLFAFG